MAKKNLFNNVERLVLKFQNKPPINPEILAKERKVIKIEKLDMETDGMLIPCKGGFIMKINNGLPLVRQRFACAHEIGHTYFFDLEKDPPVKPYTRSKTRYWIEEGICYEIGRRILLPDFLIKKWIENSKPPYIDEFTDMMNVFIVSGELLAHRIQDFNSWDTLFIFFQVHGKDAYLYKVLKSGDLGNIHIGKKGLKVRDPILHDIIVKAIDKKIIKRENVNISIGKFKGKVKIGASYIGSYPPKVIAIIKPF